MGALEKQFFVGLFIILKSRWWHYKDLLKCFWMTNMLGPPWCVAAHNVWNKTRPDVHGKNPVGMGGQGQAHGTSVRFHTLQLMDGPTDRLRDQRTDKACYRVASLRLQKSVGEIWFILFRGDGCNKYNSQCLAFGNLLCYLVNFPIPVCFVFKLLSCTTKIY